MRAALDSVGLLRRTPELPRELPDVLTLHATWEADIVERGDDSLGAFLDALLAERPRRREEVQCVVERLLKHVSTP